MEEKINIVPYLRKGLSQYIEKENPQAEGQPVADGSRAVIELTVDVQGTTPSGNSRHFYPKRELSLVGPGDIKQVKPVIISQIYPPAINTQRFNPTTMPFVEFYEADFPWRYTPLPVEETTDSCVPWLLLVAVYDDEYKLVMEKGKKRVEFNLSEERYKEVFPSASLHHKLAHVQLGEEGEDNDEAEGIARLLCASKLDMDQHITVFLLPAFEAGRLSGLNQGYAGVAKDELSWSWEKKRTVFPVYYHWSFYTANQSGTFEELANKLNMTPDEAYDTMQANLTVDIAESGLAKDGLQNYRDNQQEYPIDVPAALMLGMGNQKGKELRKEPDDYTEALKEELLLNPVFTENADTLQDEDPWVVPPVYGARHLLSTDLKGDGVVPEVNLTLRHRIAAGMGASVVKENQESFVHRAWQKVEKINELNQKLREFYQMNEVEQNARKRLQPERTNIKKLRKKVVEGKLTKSRYMLLTSDALYRMLFSSKLARNAITAEQVRDVVSNNMQPVEKVKRIIGITPQELGELFDLNTWNVTDDDFNTMVANEHIKQYKNSVSWLQFLINPYYNIGTEPSRRDLYAIKPVEYKCVQQPYLFSPECTDLYSWVAEWGTPNGHVAYNAHSLNYYYNASSHYYRQRNCFDPAYYNADLKSPIEQAVYPVTLRVKVGNAEYNGYVMDAKLFNAFCENFFKTEEEKKEQGKDNEEQKKKIQKPYLAFEYHLTNEQGKVIGKKGYTFLFPSDHPDLVYHKHIHFSINGKVLDADQPFRYTNGQCVRKTWKNGISTFYHTNDALSNYMNPFTNSLLIDDLTDLLVKVCSKPEQTEILYDPSRPDLVYVVLENGRRFYFERDDYMGIPKTGSFDSNKIDKEQFAVQLALMYHSFKANLETLRQRWMYAPDMAVVELGGFNDYSENVVRMPLPNLGLTMDDERKDQREELKKRLEAGNFNMKNGIFPEPAPAEPEPAPDLPDLEKERDEVLETLITKYGYTEEGQLDEIKSKGLTKYPVMIYPEYLDPTFFYLRELSPNYVVPSAGELTNNSVTIFESNAKFEEAFLMGMNTEMGQELLWREYPTDQRGSYFRKFWVATNLPSKEQLRTTYFDIKQVSDWNAPLGQNHAENKKAGMLVFAIKGELMQAYPRTTICLTSYADQTLTVVANASMTSWLTEDTYLVGFEDINDTKGLYLTFQEDVTSLQFENDDKFEANVNESANSAVLASKIINKSSVFLLPINNN